MTQKKKQPHQWVVLRFLTYQMNTMAAQYFYRIRRIEPPRRNMPESLDVTGTIVGHFPNQRQAQSYASQLDLIERVMES